MTRNPDNEHPARKLAATVEEYEDSPDRCTIAPDDVPREELLVQWISADRDAFVDLSEVK